MKLAIIGDDGSVAFETSDLSVLIETAKREFPKDSDATHRQLARDEMLEELTTELSEGPY